MLYAYTSADTLSYLPRFVSTMLGTYHKSCKCFSRLVLSCVFMRAYSSCMPFITHCADQQAVGIHILCSFEDT